jgi:hypothetical protein
MVGRPFVVLCVVKDVVPVHGPPASNPLVNAFVQDSCLGQLVLEVLLGSLLEVGLLAVHVVDNTVVAVGVAATEGSGLRHEAPRLLDCVAEHIF